MQKALFFLLFFTTLIVRGQQDYHTEKNIQYYPDSVAKKDNYISSQCLLDIYYPVNVKNVATIVWFHGGSLNSGDKELPVQLMNKGYAVVGVQYRLSPKVKAPA